MNYLTVIVSFIPTINLLGPSFDPHLIKGYTNQMIVSAVDGYRKGAALSQVERDLKRRHKQKIRNDYYQEALSNADSNPDL